MTKILMILLSAVHKEITTVKKRYTDDG